MRVDAQVLEVVDVPGKFHIGGLTSSRTDRSFFPLPFFTTVGPLYSSDFGSHCHRDARS
jgi:hypothetical protein